VYGSGRGHVSGPLAVYGEGFRAELLARGYAWGSAVHHVLLMAWVSRWLEAEGLGPGDLSGPVVQRCVQARRSQGYRWLVSPRAVGVMVGYLRGAGVVMREPPAGPATAVDQVLGRYQRYLAVERGLAGRSVGMYAGVARRFAGFLAAGGRGLEGADAGVVRRFMLGECSRQSPAAAKVTVTGMRALLRFLYLDGQIPVPLAGAVPAPAGWAMAALPRAISAADLGRLVDSCDRGSALGCRDLAILLLLSRLGLRAGEVAALGPGHFDWRRGEVTVCGKGGRRDVLPLPADVGEAVAAWLVQGCRAPGSPAVFVQIRAPHQRLTRQGVSHAVLRACAQAAVPAVSAHRLRHASAARILAAGGTLTEVSQVLRHSRLKTTAIYAKVDRLALSAVARPWPGTRP